MKKVSGYASSSSAEGTGFDRYYNVTVLAIVYDIVCACVLVKSVHEFCSTHFMLAIVSDMTEANFRVRTYSETAQISCSGSVGPGLI